MERNQVRKRAPAATRPEARGEGSRPGGMPMAQLWGGLPWLNPWMELWTSMWAGWLGQGLYRPPGMLGRVPAAQRRKEDSPAWLPTVEATVIPLRRHTDPPGQEADKISMRVQLPNPPWLGGGNVIAFDAVVPRSRQAEVPPDAGEDAETPKSG